MKAISQYTEVRQKILELMDLIRGNFIIVDSVEDIIHCKMRNEKGCLGAGCMYFKSVNTSVTDKENRCYFSPKSTSSHCDCSDQHILLAKLELEPHERVKELLSILTKDIPEYVKRFRSRDKCRLERIEIDFKTKDISVVWRRYNCFGSMEYYIENVHECNKALIDEKMPFFDTFKFGEF